MPSQLIDIPGLGPVEFPDTMSDVAIATAAKKLHADLVKTNETPTDVFHKSVGENVAGIASGAGGRIMDMVTGIPGAVKHLATTNPLTTIGDMAKYAMFEPARIGKQLGQGTPEAVGQSLVDTAAYIPGILGLTGAARAAAPAAAKAVGATARAIPEGATQIIGAGLGAYSGGLPGMMEGAIGGGAVGKAINLAKGLGLPKAAAEVSPNAGGRLAGAAPSLNESLVGALNDVRATPSQAVRSMELPPAMPVRGGATGRGELSAETVARQGTQGTSRPMQLVKRSADGDWYVDEQGSHHLVDSGSPAPQDTSTAVFQKAAGRTAQEDQLSQMNPNWSPNITSSGILRSEGLPETFEAQLAERADNEYRATDAARGSRLTPKPAEPAVSEDVLKSMQVVEPETGYGLNSPRGQVSESQSRGVDPEVEALVQQLQRAHVGPQQSSVPSHVGGHQVEAVPGAARTARSVYEPGGSQALTDEELMQLLHDIEQNRRP